jgi:hypothetical protein
MAVVEWWHKIRTFYEKDSSNDVSLLPSVQYILIESMLRYKRVQRTGNNRRSVFVEI